MLDINVMSFLQQEEEKQAATLARTVEFLSLADDVSANYVGVKFSIKRDVLLHLLSKCISVVPTKDRVPIILNLLAEVEDGKLTLTSSNLELSVKTSTSQVETEVPGTELIPAKKLYSIVKDSDGGEVFIEFTSKAVVIAIGATSWEIAKPTSVAKSFPRIADETLDFRPYNRLEFIRALETVKYAVCKDFTLPVYRMIKVDRGRFNAYDGNRFQRITTELDLNLDIPAYSIDTLLKKLRGVDSSTIGISQSKDKIFYSLGSEIFCTGRMLLEYPNVDTKIIAPLLSNRQQLVMSKAELLRALKSVRVTSGEDFNSVGIIVSREGAEIFSKDGDNKATCTIECDWPNKKRLIVVNHVQLTELLSVYEEDMCRFLLGEDSRQRKSPLLLKSEEHGTIGFLSQLSPLIMGIKEI